jgi:hypothetical protein
MRQPKTFEGPNLKIARGRQHTAELKGKIATYLQGDPCAVILEQGVNAAEHKRLSFYFRNGGIIPGEFSVIFGDAVHNFRTALDILANDLVALNGVKPKKVYFPFGKDAAGFESELKAKMGQAPKAIRDIVRSFKPYVGGNNLLRAMHDLDIGDKHIAIMKAEHAGRIDIPAKQSVTGNQITLEPDPDAIETILIDMTGFPVLPDYRPIGKVVGSEIVFTIATGLPLDGIPVIKVLNDMGDLTQRVVKTLETHCFG